MPLRCLNNRQQEQFELSELLLDFWRVFDHLTREQMANLGCGVERGWHHRTWQRPADRGKVVHMVWGNRSCGCRGELFDLNQHRLRSMLCAGSILNNHIRVELMMAQPAQFSFSFVHQFRSASPRLCDEPQVKRSA
jgi:hypothetical protein